ncbi:unnamed protein product [Lactuca saligna]|uniref:Uncharacterized protein n=1 Tax=Lactuca saligna TaxID=75948 RepID=A0AA35ZPT5_LACSI|nr:unnamed protein product [Lactuca saligna]
MLRRQTLTVSTTLTVTTNIHQCVYYEEWSWSLMKTTMKALTFLPGPQFVYRWLRPQNRWLSKSRKAKRRKIDNMRTRAFDGEYAFTESTFKVKIFNKSFQEKKSIMLTFSAERI